jgi:pimeloyl-ACP methyl ester carboxylesterase
MKYFLIHGYGKALDLFEHSIPSNGGFYIFDEEITREEAYVHHWAEQIERRRLTALNPFTQLKLYYQERVKTESPAEIKRLHDTLQEKQPIIIITHSSGARLLMNYLKSYSLPESVQKVILVQADISQKEWLACPLPTQVEWRNFWCWWDQALITSMIVNQYIPMGLYTRDHTYSQFYPLRMLPNPHQDIWRDKKFKQILEKEMR